MKIRLLFCLILTSALNAQSASDILTKVQNKFNTINNFSASFSQTCINKQDKTSNKVTGKFYYKKKNRFNVELNAANIISDGETIWNYNKSSNRAVISNLENDPSSFSLERFIFDYPKMCDMKLIKDKSIKSGEDLLELIPNNQKLQFKKARIFVSSDGMISKLEITDQSEIQYVFQFTDIKYNIDLPDSKFTFSPPKGIQIIDLK